MRTRSIMAAPRSEPERVSAAEETLSPDKPVATSNSTVVGSSFGYFFSRMLIMAGSFISLPVLTRLLTKQDYGLLNLTWATVGILALLNRAGFPEATIRFYNERLKLGRHELREFCSSMLGGTLGAGAIVGVASLIGVSWILGESRPSLASCLRLGILVAAVRAISVLFQQIYRAQERVMMLSTIQVITRYLSLALAIGFVLFIRADAYQVILGTLIAEAIVGAFCLGELARRGILGWPTLSPPIIRAANTYGVPLMFVSSASLILDYGDRFLIERFLGLQAVATYAVPYDFTQALAVGILGSLKMGLVPIGLRMWANGEAKPLSKLLSRVLSYSICLGVPISTLFILLNQDVIVLLASEKYVSSGGLIVYLLPGVALGELGGIVAMGLMIDKNTATIAAYSVLAGAVNVVLNLVLLPTYGLAGAAVATTLSYALLLTMIYAKSRRVVPLWLDYAVIVRGLAATVALVVVVLALGRLEGTLIERILVKGFGGIAAMMLVLLCLDANVRRWTLATLPWRMGR